MGKVLKVRILVDCEIDVPENYLDEDGDLSEEKERELTAQIDWNSGSGCIMETVLVDK